MVGTFPQMLDFRRVHPDGEPTLPSHRVHLNMKKVNLSVFLSNKPIKSFSFSIKFNPKVWLSKSQTWQYDSWQVKAIENLKLGNMVAFADDL